MSAWQHTDILPSHVMAARDICGDDEATIRSVTQAISVGVWSQETTGSAKLFIVEVPHKVNPNVALMVGTGATPTAALIAAKRRMAERRMSAPLKTWTSDLFTRSADHPFADFGKQAAND